MPGLDANTKLLLHFNGLDGAKEIIDSGNTGHIVNQTANAELSTADKKFGSSAVDFFDIGTLEVPDSDDWTFGTGDFTIDFWVNFTADTAVGFIGQHTDGSNRFLFNHSSSNGNLSTFLSSGGVTIWQITSSTNSFVPNTGQWYHLALVRNGNTIDIYVDGTSIASGDVTGDTHPDMTGPLVIGQQPSGINPLRGLMDEIRVSKGVARWTTNFTPETEEYESDANTVLLLHCNTRDVSGDGGSGTYHIPDFINNAQIDTAQSKFGGASILFTRASADKVTILDSEDFNFGTGDFTIDYWVRFATLPSSGEWYGMFHQSVNFNDDDSIRCLLRGNDQTFELNWTYDGSSIQASNYAWTPSIDTWYHVAIVRNGSDFRVYIDGSSIGTTDVATNSFHNSSANFELGFTTDVHYLNGWLDEFRVSKGVARWTAPFTPPTGEYNTLPAILSLNSQSIVIV